MCCSAAQWPRNLVESFTDRNGVGRMKAGDRERKMVVEIASIIYLFRESGKLIQ